jgi:hypothetical protein
MVLHHNPASIVIELISGAKELSESVMSNLPRGAILSTQVHYALVNTSDGTKNDADIFGQPFELGELEGPLPTDIAPADMLVISERVNKLKGLKGILERLIGLTKPDATVVVVATNDAIVAALEVKGFQLISNIQGTEPLSLYSRKEALRRMTTNGTTKQEVIVIQPFTSPSATQEFSSVMQSVLRDQGYPVYTKTWTDGTGIDAARGKTYISLLELEQPMLDNLTKPDFEGIRKLLLNCERLIWITCGDNPSFGMVDGFARCIASEIAGIRFQILHLSQATGMQCGPSLAARILASDSIDSEFREQRGLLQVARIYKSFNENGHLRRHLQDSTRIMALGNQNHTLSLTIGRPGLLDTLHFVPDERMLTQLADHEVELQVKAAGIK